MQTDQFRVGKEATHSSGGDQTGPLSLLQPGSSPGKQDPHTFNGG